MNQESRLLRSETYSAEVGERSHETFSALAASHP